MVIASGRELAELRDLVRNKPVALIGNSASYREFPEILERHEIIVRINRGAEHMIHAGFSDLRTDMLLVSGILDSTLLQSVQNVAWMSPKGRDEIPPEIAKTLFFYPTDSWERLRAEIGSRPSTGCMGIDLFSNLVADGELWLYGFDFWRSPTSYTDRNRPGPHDPAAEERFAQSRIPRYRIVFP